MTKHGPDDRELFGAIAERVAERRRAWGLSQRELAELCGTTQSAIARVERGARPPRIDTLARIAAALAELGEPAIAGSNKARLDVGRLRS